MVNLFTVTMKHQFSRFTLVTISLGGGFMAGIIVSYVSFVRKIRKKSRVHEKPVVATPGHFAAAVAEAIADLIPAVANGFIAMEITSITIRLLLPSTPNAGKISIWG